MRSRSGLDPPAEPAQHAKLGRKQRRIDREIGHQRIGPPIIARAKHSGKEAGGEGGGDRRDHRDQRRSSNGRPSALPRQAITPPPISSPPSSKRRKHQRQAQQDPPGDVGIGPALRSGRGRGLEAAGRGEDLAAHMVEAAAVERLDPVAGRMVAGLVAGDGEAQGAPAFVLEHHDVGVIGDELGEIGHQRIGVGASRDGGIIIERGAIGVAGLEHHRRPADPARFDVDQRADLARQRVAVDEGAGAVEAEFLAFVEQQDDRMRRRLRLQIGRDLEQGRDPDPVVGRAGPGRRAVVMGVEQQRLARQLSPDHGDDIAGQAAADGARPRHAAAILALAHLRRQAERAEFGDQAGADRVIGLAVDRVRALVAEDPA